MLDTPCLRWICFGWHVRRFIHRRRRIGWVVSFPVSPLARSFSAKWIYLEEDMVASGSHQNTRPAVDRRAGAQIEHAGNGEVATANHIST